MKILETAPDQVVNVFQYLRELEEGQYHDLDYVRERIGDTVCTRLVVNRYGDRDDDFAGDFTLEVANLREPKHRRQMQPGMMKVMLSLPGPADIATQKTKPGEYYLSPNGILLPTNRLKWALFGAEIGYFPKTTNGWDDALDKLVVEPSPTEPLLPV